MIVFIKLKNEICYEDYSDGGLVTVNDDYVKEIQIALEGWRSYFNCKRGLMTYEDQMFYDGYNSKPNDYQQFVMDYQKAFEEFKVNSYIGNLADFIEFFNYVYPDAEMELIHPELEFEIDINE